LYTVLVEKKSGFGKTVLCPLISPREGEILLVDLAPFIDIGVQVNLRGFDGGMTEIFLDYPEIL